MNITAEEFNKVNEIISNSQKEIEKISPIIIIEVGIRTIDTSEISKVVETIYHRLRLPRNDKSQESQYLWIRDIVMFYLKRTTKFTLAAIGKTFEGKDHSTVISAIERASKRLDEQHFESQRLMNEIENLKLL